MAIFLLNEKDMSFPDPYDGQEDGLLAVGGDLCFERLMNAYMHGIFPWYNPGEDILWWCPKERFIIRPDKVHVSHSLKKYMKKHKYEMLINRDFKDAMHRCRMLREGSTWIGDEMERAYFNLHEKGFAVSVEVNEDGELAGGLYGVSIGRNFFGESMFSVKENGSKIALVMFAELLAKAGFGMIDCQMPTNHLLSMGGEHISYKEYMDLLMKGIQ